MKPLKCLQAGQPRINKGGILTLLIEQLTEAALAAELEAHINSEALNSCTQTNRKNISTSKTIKSTSDSFSLDMPRDRAGSFDPQLVKKHQTHMSDEIERKVLSLNTRLGSSYSDTALSHNSPYISTDA